MPDPNPPKQSFWDYFKGNVADNQAYGGFKRKYRPVQSVPPTNQGPGIFQKLYEMMQGLDNNINDPALLNGLTGPHGRVQLQNQAIDPALVMNQLMGKSTPIINAAVNPAKKLKLASK